MNPETPSDADLDEYVGEMVSKGIKALSATERAELAKRQEAGTATVRLDGEDDEFVYFVYADLIRVKVDKLRTTPGRGKSLSN